MLMIVLACSCRKTSKGSSDDRENNNLVRRGIDGPSHHVPTALSPEAVSPSSQALQQAAVCAKIVLSPFMRRFDQCLHLVDMDALDKDIGPLLRDQSIVNEIVAALETSSEAANGSAPALTISTLAAAARKLMQHGVFDIDGATHIVQAHPMLAACVRSQLSA